MKSDIRLMPQLTRVRLSATVQVDASPLTDPVERELHHQARVYDQHAECDSRERRTAAATFGIGSPVSVSPHPAGSGAISGSSPGPVETTMRARAASTSSRSRISRSSFSFAVMVQAYRPHPRLFNGDDADLVRCFSHGSLLTRAALAGGSRCAPGSSRPLLPHENSRRGH